MADNIQWILEQNPGAKMVVWAHNGHVSRGRAWGHVAMGSFLTEKFPNEMIVFGFATARGFYTAFNGEKLASDNPLLEAPPASVESVLDSAGLPRLMLDIRGATRSEPGTAWAATSVPMRSIGAVAMAQQFFPIVPKEHFDVLVWQAETAASVSLPR